MQKKNTTQPKEQEIMTQVLKNQNQIDKDFTYQEENIIPPAHESQKIEREVSIEQSISDEIYHEVPFESNYLKKKYYTINLAGLVNDVQKEIVCLQKEIVCLQKENGELEGSLKNLRDFKAKINELYIKYPIMKEMDEFQKEMDDELKILKNKVCLLSPKHFMAKYEWHNYSQVTSKQEREKTAQVEVEDPLLKEDALT